MKLAGSAVFSGIRSRLGVAGATQSSASSVCRSASPVLAACDGDVIFHRIDLDALYSKKQETWKMNRQCFWWFPPPVSRSASA